MTTIVILIIIKTKIINRGTHQTEETKKNFHCSANKKLLKE